MKPDTADSVLLPERTLGKRVKVIADEVANGEYGLVINGHSLVRHKRFLNSHMCHPWTSCIIMCCLVLLLVTVFK